MRAQARRVRARPIPLRVVVVQAHFERKPEAKPPQDARITPFSQRRREKKAGKQTGGHETRAKITASPPSECVRGEDKLFDGIPHAHARDADLPCAGIYDAWDAAGINNSVWFDDDPEKLKKRFVREEVGTKIVAWGVSPSFGGVVGAAEKLEQKPFDRRLEYHSFQRIAFMEFGGRPFALRPPLVETSVRPTRSVRAVAPIGPSAPRAVATAGSLARTRTLPIAPALAGVGKAPSVVIDSAWGFAPRLAWGVKVVEAVKATAAKAGAAATWINEGAGYLGGKHPLWPARNEAYVFELLKAGYQHIKDALSHLFYKYGGDSFLWLGKSQKYYRE